MTVVRTSLGALRGTTGVTQFHGIPYATADRFRPPVPVTAWPGGRDARRDGPIAPQPPARHLPTRDMATAPQDEACLTLSIATPAMSPSSEPQSVAVEFSPRPVVVFIHGGGYETGAGSCKLYDPALLCAECDVVVVRLNYRLGALGFLYLPGVAEGNMGLLDIIAALHWLQSHIAEFGGDAANITLVGHEAGAHAILCLLTMWDSQGLFQRAFLASCPIGIPPQSRDIAREIARQFCEAAGVNATDLAKLSAPQIIAAQAKVGRDLHRFADIAMPFMPVFDALHGHTDATLFTLAAAQSAAARGIRMIIGTTREELHGILAADSTLLPASPLAIANRFTEITGAADTITLYRHRRAGGEDCDLLGDLMTDHLFLFPALALAEAITNAGGQAWVYQFDWSPRGSPLRACQGIDLACLFGTASAWAETHILDDVDPTEFSSIGNALRAALGEFAHTDDPDAPGLPWPPYRLPSRLTMRFDTALGPIGDPAGANWRLGE